MKNLTQTSKIVALTLCLGILPIATFVTGCAGDRYHQSTGESIDDHSTSMRVKSALANDAEYKFSDVEVTTFKGVVQLSGFVDTSAQKSRAATIAKNLDNIKEVKNNISVKQ